MGSRRSKKLLFGACATVCVVFASVLLFYGCKKDESVTQTETSAKQQKSIDENLFYNLIENETLTSIVAFSSFLLPMNVERIDILEVSSEEQFVTFSVVGLTSIFVNDIPIDFSEGRIYRLNKTDNVYKLTDNQTDFAVSYDIDDNKILLHFDGYELDFNSLTDEMIEDDFIFSSVPVYIALIFDFTVSAQRERPVFNLPLQPEICTVYRGTWINFHSSRSDATFRANRSVNNILSNNSGWYTTGVSVSCLWDNHFCMVTANFYEDVLC